MEEGRGWALSWKPDSLFPFLAHTFCLLYVKVLVSHWYELCKVLKNIIKLRYHAYEHILEHTVLFWIVMSQWRSTLRCWIKLAQRRLGKRVIIKMNQCCHSIDAIVCELDQSYSPKNVYKNIWANHCLIHVVSRLYSGWTRWKSSNK